MGIAVVPNGRVVRVVCAVLVLALAACGGSSKNKSESPTTQSKSAASSTSSSSTSTTVPDAAADEALAKSLVLVTADLPAGWTPSVHQKDPDSARLDQQLADCMDASDPSASTVDIDGLDFDLGDAEVSSSVTVQASHADFQRDAAALTGPKYRPCLKQLLEPELQRQLQKDSPGATVTGVDLAPRSTPTYGDVTVAVRATVTVAVNGQSIVFFIDDVAYGSDRVEVDVSFFNVGAPFDAELERTLVAKAGAKLDGAI
jgi:hypothetical protein